VTHRERVLTALNHEEPDRVPVYVEYTPEAKARMLDHVCKSSTAPGDADLDSLLDHDLRSFQIGPVTGYYLRDDPEYEDEWGIRWKWVRNPAGSRYTEIAVHPLADLTDPARIKVPDFTRQERYAKCVELVRNHGRDCCIVGSIVCTLFELSWYLRGLTRVMQDMCLNKDFLHAYLDKLLGWAMEAGAHLVETGVDIIYLGDDFGSQSSMLISPEMFREFFKPRYAKLYARFREINPAVRIAHHSCGHILPIIDDFVELGLDVLNPIQPLAMDPSEIKKRFGKRLTLWGTVDEQRVLPFGTAEEVASEVKLRLRTVAPGGGFILAPAHNVQADTPLANILALYETAQRHGAYPIQL
jgi:uroporphyrinogen decarboxylase